MFELQFFGYSYDEIADMLTDRHARVMLTPDTLVQLHLRHS